MQFLKDQPVLTAVLSFVMVVVLFVLMNVFSAVRNERERQKNMADAARTIRNITGK